MSYIQAVIPKLGVRQFQRLYPQARYYFFGLSGASFVYAGYCVVQRKATQEDIEYRKSQLSKEVYELRDEELVHPPWNKSNMREWLYRPIRVTGRPIHGRAMYVARAEMQQDGFEYIVPFVTKENKDQSEQWGLLVSLGYIPKAFQPIANRFKLENAKPQTFDCYLSQLTELQDHGPTTGNFAGRWQKWNYVDLEQMSEYTGFQNQDKIGGVLERIALDTPLDERNMRNYDQDGDFHKDYPYIKTKSGALFTRNRMPWDWQRNTNYGISSAFFCGAIGALLHMVR